MASKEESVIKFLLDCPTIRDNPTFFNFINAKPDNKQIVTSGNDARLHRPYIDGSVLKRYTFTVIDFRSVNYQPIPKGISPDISTNENVEEYLDVQGVIDWIQDKADAYEFPDFGNMCKVEAMRALTDNPVMNGIDTQVKPALAKYSFSIQIDYIDYSKAINH